MKFRTLNLFVFAAAAVAMSFTSAPVLGSEADDAIKTLFEKTYVYTTFLKDDGFKTDVKDGVVTFTGTVAEESHRNLALDTVANLPGVIRVDNNLATTAEVASESADVWIGRKVKLTLLFHRNVNAGATSVAVKDGVVTLQGVAASLAQKDLTAEYAKDISGVKEVIVEMTVATAPAPIPQTMGEKLDDASITAQVKMALVTHQSTSALGTKVATRDGEVTVTGIAKNAAEISLVTKLVNDIHGVTKVKNEMTIEEVKTK